MYREELGYGAGALVIFSVLVAGDLWLGWSTAPLPYLFAMVALIIGGSRTQIVDRHLPRDESHATT